MLGLGVRFHCERLVKLSVAGGDLFPAGSLPIFQFIQLGLLCFIEPTEREGVVPPKQVL